MRESLDKVSVLCSELVLLLVVTLLGLVTLMTVFLALFVVMIGWSPVMSDSDSKYIKVSKISNIAEYYIVEVLLEEDGQLGLGVFLRQLVEEDGAPLRDHS